MARKSTPVRFLVDENLSLAFADAVRHINSTLDVLHVGDPGAPPIGTKDPDILHYCEAERRALITNDRATMGQHAAQHLLAGHHHWGIFKTRPGRSIGAYQKTLRLIWTDSAAEDWFDVEEWIPW